MNDNIDRRHALKASAAAAVAATLPVSADDKPATTRGRVRQSLVNWCYSKYWKIDEICELAVKLGCASIELGDPRDWPTLKKHGLTCAIAGSHGFEKGMNNPKYHAMCNEKLIKSIDASAEFGCPSVITFTGFRENVSDEDGIKNCVAGFKAVLSHAEKKKVTLCLEMLNSRVNAEMKGHPGYQGDHVDYCMEIIRKVSSERLKLLFDIYHVQIMDGDLITRVRQCGEAIGHVHTAGNPGRGELDDKQEINYPAVIRALVDVGYKGYVGQEFIPTRDPAQGLKEAVVLCDV
jgi:hydroxypyruvate isomerase